MKKIVWLGTSYKDLRELPKRAQKVLGYQLHLIQSGDEPDDWKPMKGIGAGVKEIRVHLENEYRTIYVAKFEEAIYVLHTFVKKTQATSVKDIAVAKQRFKQMMNERN